MIGNNRFSEYTNTFSKVMQVSDKAQNKFLPQVIGKNVTLGAGVDQGKYALSVVSDFKDIELTSTELIQVSRAILNNAKMALVFTLNDENLLSIFISFAMDLEGIIDGNADITVVELYNRYLYWQKMFKTKANKISEEKIKGLIGELNILENFMIPKYGADEAIRGWIGTENSHKDFAYSDGMWYEAKSVNVGKITVNISSIEQLQSDTAGLLLISKLEKTSIENPEGVRLLDLLNRVKKQLIIEDVALSFFNKINSIGFSLDVFTDENHPGNSCRYIIQKVNCYLVNNKFPRLIRDELPTAIGSVSYEIVMAKIEDNTTTFK